MKRFLLIFILLLMSLSARVFGTELTPEATTQLTLLEKWVDETMAYYHIPGVSVGIVQDQELVWAKGFGVANIETAEPMRPAHLFRIASISKLFTSTAIMQLRDAGKVSLEDPIQKYLPWFEIQNEYEGAAAITIRHLLTHTSGLPREAAFPYWTDHIFPTTAQIKAALPTQKMKYAPDTHFQYSNLGMALLGHVVAAASGEAYESYIENHIFKPLKMQDSQVKISENDPGLASGYLRYREGYPRELAPFTESNGVTPAANLSSNVPDLAQFCKLQFRDDLAVKGVVNGRTLQEMHRIHWLQPHWKSGWGLGFSISRLDNKTIIGHAGWVAGYRTQILFNTESKVAVIVLINTEDFSPATIAKKTFQLVEPVFRAPDKEEAPEEPQFDTRWEQFVGTYQDPTYWETDVLLLNKKLFFYSTGYPANDTPKSGLSELIPVELPFVFRNKDNDEIIVFETDETTGKVVRIKNGENYYFPIAE